MKLWYDEFTAWAGPRPVAISLRAGGLACVAALAWRWSARGAGFYAAPAHAREGLVRPGGRGGQLGSAASTWPPRRTPCDGTAPAWAAAASGRPRRSDRDEVGRKRVLVKPVLREPAITAIMLHELAQLLAQRGP